MRRDLSNSTITGGTRNSQAGAEEGISRRREGRTGRHEWMFGWVPWVRWVLRKNVSEANKGLLWFDDDFRGACAEGLGRPESGWVEGRIIPATL